MGVCQYNLDCFDFLVSAEFHTFDQIMANKLQDGDRDHTGVGWLCLSLTGCSNQHQCWKTFCHVSEVSGHQDEFFKEEDTPTEESYRGYRTGGAGGERTDRGGGNGKSRQVGWPESSGDANSQIGKEWPHRQLGVVPDGNRPVLQHHTALCESCENRF